MKLKLLFIVLITVFELNAQNSNDLYVEGNVRLGENCSASQNPQVLTYENIYFSDDSELKLKNVKLIVTGNIYVNCENDHDRSATYECEAELKGCGQSTYCIQGEIQGDLEIEDDLSEDCSVLGVHTSVLSKDFTMDYQRKVITVKNAKFIEFFDISGKSIKRQSGNSCNFSDLEKGIYIIKTDKYIIKQIIY